MSKVAFKKSDDELQIIWGEAYVPGIPDAQHDFMTAESIMKMAYSWMAKGKTRCIDVEHDNRIVNAYVVESYVARKNDPDGFIEGSWVVGVHIPDDGVWQRVKKGELNGFSIQGMTAVGRVQDIEIPGDVVGVTKAANDHTHNFTVAYDDAGEFIGGVTDAVDGHFHVIRKGTVTEEADGHRHTYDFVRGVISAEGNDQIAGTD